MWKGRWGKTRIGVKITMVVTLKNVFRYKCPMLRGQMDADISKHEKIEELMASDLDHWLCNLYFHVIKLPR